MSIYWYAYRHAWKQCHNTWCIIYTGWWVSITLPKQYKVCQYCARKKKSHIWNQDFIRANFHSIPVAPVNPVRPVNPAMPWGPTAPTGPDEPVFPCRPRAPGTVNTFTLIFIVNQIQWRQHQRTRPSYQVHQRSCTYPQGRSSSYESRRGQLSVESRLWPLSWCDSWSSHQRTEYQLLLMKISWWDRNVKIRYKSLVVIDEFLTVTSSPPLDPAASVVRCVLTVQQDQCRQQDKAVQSVP